MCAVKLLYYVNYRVGPPPPETIPLPQSVEIPNRCMELDWLDPRRRLVDLIPGDELINLDNRNSRTNLESWILSFCGSETKIEEWDPFTAEMRSLSFPLDMDIPAKLRKALDRRLSHL